MNSNRILAVVIMSAMDDYLSCFQASTVTGVMGGVWIAGRGHRYVKACFLIEGFRSKSYFIASERYPEGDKEMIQFLRDAVEEGWRPLSRGNKNFFAGSPQFGRRG